MTERSDIIDGNLADGRRYGLIYTRRCGWVDLGHASPEGADGAKSFWNKILGEFDEGGSPSGHFRITYRQRMGNKFFKASHQKTYDILKGLSLADKKSVALFIFNAVSDGFEDMQASYPYRLFTNSGYSAEDLVSDLIGFYRAIDPVTPYIQICQPVSKADALKVWDTYGPVGSTKNHGTGPYIYPIPPAFGAPVCAQLPIELNRIRPAQPGKLFKIAR